MNLELSQNVTKLYKRLTGQYMKGKPPVPPFLVLDQNDTIQQAHPGIKELIGYSPEEVEGKHYADFFSDDLYFQALHSIAYRVQNVTKHPRDLEHKIGLFESDLKYVTDNFSLPGRINRFNKLINKFVEKGRKPWQAVKAHDRVRTKDNAIRTLADTIYLIADETPRNYLGSFVSLKEERSAFDHFLGGWLGWGKMKSYSIKEESVLSVDSLADKGRVQAYVQDFIAEHDAPTLVVDFADVRKVQKSLAMTFFELLGDRAQKGTLVVGNPSEHLQKLINMAMAGKYGKRAPAVRFHRLVYPPIQEPATGENTFNTITAASGLESYIKNEIEILKHANGLSKQSVPSVPSNSEGKSDDVQAAR